MANEITVTAALQLNNAESAHSIAESLLKVDQSGHNFIEHVQDIGTSEEAIVLGDTGNGGYCFLKNLDGANPVNIRQGTGTTNMIQLGPGEVALFRWATATTAPYAIATTASVRLRVVIYEA